VQVFQAQSHRLATLKECIHHRSSRLSIKKTSGIGLEIGLPIAATSTSEEAYGHTGLIVAGAAIAAEVVGDYLIDPRKIQ
jgi:hypothetical protein